MKRRTLLSASLGLGALGCLGAAGAWLSTRSSQAELKPYSASALAFGTTVTIKVLHDDLHAAEKAVNDALHEISHVNALMSVYQEQSQVFRLNRDGRLDDPAPHLRYVLRFAQQLSILTAGAFDITVQPLWLAFSRAHESGRLPDANEIAAARALVDWRQLEIRPEGVRMQSAGMAVTLNGIAQGYAVDLALEALLKGGVKHALLDSGEFASAGNKSNGQPWMLGIRHPRQEDAFSAAVKMDGRKVATSGDYETTFSPDFVHHHIFDPARGDSPPALASATVVAPSGILADGLSTAFMVMGPEKAFALAQRLPDVDAMLIGKDGGMVMTPDFPAAPA